jgi:hypothetical protein
MRPVKSYGAFPHGHIRKSPIARSDSAGVDEVKTEPVQASVNQQPRQQHYNSNKILFDTKTIAITVAKTAIAESNKSTNTQPAIHSQEFLHSAIMNIPFIPSLSLSACQKPADKAKPAITTEHAQKRFIVIVDSMTVQYFDYELERACSEIRLINPKAAECMYIIKFSVSSTDNGNMLRVITPARVCTLNIGATYEFSHVVKILHREIQQIPSDIRNSTKIIGCSPTLSCTYLRILDPITYANMMFSESVGHLINLCFDLNYIPRTPLPGLYRDSCIEEIAKVVINGINGGSIRYYSVEVQNYFAEKYPSINAIVVFRDPRFEWITNLRFNPWLYSFESIQDNGRCISLFNKSQCVHRKLTSLNYCSVHMCGMCTYACRHIGGAHGTIKIFKK